MLEGLNFTLQITLTSLRRYAIISTNIRLEGDSGLSSYHLHCHIVVEYLINVYHDIDPMW